MSKRAYEIYDRPMSDAYKKSAKDVSTLLEKIKNKEDLSNYFERKYLND